MRPLILSAYHKPAPRIESAAITPIHVGRARARAPLPDMIGDDTAIRFPKKSSLLRADRPVVGLEERPRGQPCGADALPPAAGFRPGP